MIYLQSSMGPQPPLHDRTKLKARVSVLFLHCKSISFLSFFLIGFEAITKMEPGPQPHVSHVIMVPLNFLFFKKKKTVTRILWELFKIELEFIIN
jgi:hypothetical protein